MSDFEMPTPANHRPEVKKAREAVEKEKTKTRQLESELQETRQELEAAREALGELKADARIGEATEEEVSNARALVEKKGKRVDALMEEIESSRRAVEKLESRVRRRKKRANQEIKATLREEYNQRLKSAAEKVQDARQALQAAAEIGDEASKNSLRGYGDRSKLPANLQGEPDLTVVNRVGSDLMSADDLVAAAKRAYGPE